MFLESLANSMSVDLINTKLPVVSYKEKIITLSLWFINLSLQRRMDNSNQKEKYTYKA